MNSDRIELTRFRVTIEMITEERHQQEQKLADALWEGGVEMPLNPNPNWEIKIPMTDPGIVRFERDLQDLCREYNQTNWYPYSNPK